VNALQKKKVNYDNLVITHSTAPLPLKSMGNPNIKHYSTNFFCVDNKYGLLVWKANRTVWNKKIISKTTKPKTNSVSQHF